MASQMLFRLTSAGVNAGTGTGTGAKRSFTSRLATAVTRNRNQQQQYKYFSSTALQEQDEEEKRNINNKSHESESFLSGTSSLYAEQMYEHYLEHPETIHPSWRKYFENLEQGIAYNEADYDKPTAEASSVKRAQSGVRNFFFFFFLMNQSIKGPNNFWSDWTFRLLKLFFFLNFY